MQSELERRPSSRYDGAFEETGTPGVIETPSYQERVLFLGANGSGKTILASRMIEPYPRAVILDIKYDFPIPWAKDEYAVLTKPPGRGGMGWLFDPWRNHDRIVYRPGPPADSGPAITGFLDAMFQRGRREGKTHPFILYLDEGGWAAYAGAKMGMSRLAIAGRSLGIGLWISAQRPRGIPVEVRSEAWRTYVFYLRKSEDREELLSTLDDQAWPGMFAGTAEEYQFWEVRRGPGGRLTYRLMPPMDMPEARAEKPRD